MWGCQETAAMEYYSESNTEPKLIDFFKCEMPLRKDHGGAGEQTYVYRPGNQELGGEGNGASQELPVIADGGRSLKLETPSGIFLDFLSGNGDHPNHQLVVSRSSSVEGKHPMAPKSIQDAVTADQWSLVMAPNLPNLALKLVSPSPTGTQASGTSPPKTPNFDMELNSRTRAQPCMTTVPDHEGESQTFSADSDRRLIASFLHRKGESHGKDDSRVYRWSPKNGQKRLKIRTQSDDHDDDAAMLEAKLESRTRDGSTTCRKVREKDAEEREAVAQAAASLLSLSSNEDDWQPTSSARAPIRGQNVSSSSSLSLAALGEGSERESGEVGSFVGCSGSVLSRPSNKRRYRSVVDLLAESPRVR